MVGGSIAPPVAVFLSSCRVVVKALLAAANWADLEDNQSSWHTFCNMSGLDASFPMYVAMVSRHARTVYNMRRVYLLCPEIASWNGHDVMISPSFMVTLNWNGVG